MKTKITIEHERKVSEVKVVYTVEEANELLNGGWMLMGSGISHRDAAGYQAKPTFILAKQEV